MHYPIDPRLGSVSSADWFKFCAWLRECCGIDHPDEIPFARQYDAYLRWLDESLPEEVSE